VTQKITKAVVDAVKAGEKPQKIFDKEPKGFCLIVTPKGSKSYAVEYRIGRGRHLPAKRYIIGKHGSPWTPEMARKEAKKILGLVAQGSDPAQEKKPGMKFGELLDLYFKEGVANKQPNTIKIDRARAERYLRPILGKKPLEGITRGDVERMRDEISQRAHGPDQGKGVARQCVALMSVVYTFANQREICEGNPARGVKTAPVRMAERFLSEAEISRLAEALEEEVQRGTSAWAIAAIRLLLFTGARRSEIANLMWSQVDFERRVVRLPRAKENHRTGAIKTIRLNAPALEVLNGLPKQEGNPLVICGVRTMGVAYGAVNQVWRRVRRTAGLEDVRLHDLRHSFASEAAASGTSLYMIGKLLGHRRAATTERYAHLSDDPLQKVNDMVGQRIAAAMGKAKSA
jgi:integrase